MRPRADADSVGKERLGGLDGYQRPLTMTAKWNHSLRQYIRRYHLLQGNSKRQLLAMPFLWDQGKHLFGHCVQRDIERGIFNIRMQAFLNAAIQVIS